MMTTTSDILGGSFRESVLVQQRDSCVVTTENTMSTFICTIAAIEGAALGT